MFRLLSDFILRFRVYVLLGMGLIVLANAPFLQGLRFDFTPQQLFAGTQDVLEQREKFAAEFGREDNLVTIIVEGDSLFEPKTLEWIRDFTVSLREFEEVKNAQSLPTMEIPRSGAEAGLLTTVPIVLESGEVEPSAAAALKELAANEPLLNKRVISPDLETTVVLVWLQDDLQDVKDLRAAILKIEAKLAESGVPSELRTRVSGIPYLRQEIVENLKTQQLTFVPATGLAYLLILFFMFRRFSGVVLPLGVVAITMVLVTGMMVFTDSPINIINNILPSLVFIIGVSDSIHMIARDGEENEAGADRASSVKAMIRHTGLACLLTSTTTAVGFFSLLAADTEILKNFGWQAGASVLLAYLITLLFLPAALVKMRPVQRLNTQKPDYQPWIEKFMGVLGEKVVAHPWRFFVSGLVITAIAAVAAFQVEIDTILLEVYEPGHPTYNTLKMSEEKLGGILPIEISLDSSEPGAFKNPENYKKLAELQTFSKQFDVVLSTQSLVDYHQAARAALLADPAQRGNMPESRDEIEQLHLLLAGAPDSRSGASQFVSTDFSHVRLLLRVADDGAKAQLALGNELKEKLGELFPPGHDVSWVLTGDAYVASISLDSFIRDLFGSLLLAMVIIFGMMTVAFRSIRLGLISVLPNATPLILTLGYMGVRGIDLNTTTIITFSIGLGLAVDDTIHFLARYQEERDAGRDASESLKRAYMGAGRAIMLTSVMLLIGLGVLLMSDFVPTRLFGTLTGITIAGAILGDLIILPPLLYLVDSCRDRRTNALPGTV